MAGRVDGPITRQFHKRVEDYVEYMESEPMRKQTIINQKAVGDDNIDRIVVEVGTLHSTITPVDLSHMMKDIFIMTSQARRLMGLFTEDIFKYWWIYHHYIICRVLDRHMLTAPGVDCYFKNKIGVTPKDNYQVDDCVVNWEME